MSIASNIFEKSQKTYPNNSIGWGDKSKVVAKITEHSWNASTSKYTAVMFEDNSILLLDFDTDDQEPNPPLAAYADEILNSFNSLEELKNDVRTWNYDELQEPTFQEILL